EHHAPLVATLEESIIEASRILRAREDRLKQLQWNIQEMRGKTPEEAKQVTVHPVAAVLDDNKDGPNVVPSDGDVDRKRARTLSPSDHLEAVTTWAKSHVADLRATAELGGKYLDVQDPGQLWHPVAERIWREDA